MLKSLNHWVFAFILCERITNPLTGKCIIISIITNPFVCQGDSMIVGNPQEVVVESRHNSAYIVGLVAALRSVVQKL